MFVWAVASKTGWSEDYIFWHLPLSRGLQYLHCIAAGNPSVWVVERTESEKLGELSDSEVALFDNLEALDVDLEE